MPALAANFHDTLLVSDRNTVVRKPNDRASVHHAPRGGQAEEASIFAGINGVGSAMVALPDLAADNLGEDPAPTPLPLVPNSSPMIALLTPALIAFAVGAMLATIAKAR